MMWTSLGLNHGPPDYEKFCTLFHKILRNCKALKISTCFILRIGENCVSLQKFSKMNFT